MQGQQIRKIRLMNTVCLCHLMPRSWIQTLTWHRLCQTQCRWLLPDCHTSVSQLNYCWIWSSSQSPKCTFNSRSWLQTIHRACHSRENNVMRSIMKHIERVHLISKLSSPFSDLSIVMFAAVWTSPFTACCILEDSAQHCSSNSWSKNTLATCPCEKHVPEHFEHHSWNTSGRSFCVNCLDI